ncbi:MAG: beta-L-arabinofuranosidase domain-containing protein [Bauldia sp.]
MRRYSPVNFAAVAIEGPFWRERLETVLARTIPSQYRRLAENGAIESLSVPEVASPPPTAPDGLETAPEMLWEAEVGKWLEAASYAFVARPDPALAEQIDGIATRLAEAQLPDGYLNSWHTGRAPGKRWSNLRDNHELYTAGHLIEAAVAHFQATGERRLIDVALKYVDHIAETFGRGEEQKHGYGGYQEIELALARLYGVTQDEKHLELAAYFIDERGNHPHYFDIEAVARGDETEDFLGRTYEYNQSHRRVRHQDRAVGHAARAMNMYAAMADLAGERGDASLKRACEVLWEDVTQRHMYVTGGIGASRKNEGFGEPYDLPNETGHADTGAAVGLVLWAKRMLNLDLDGRYADVMELALYNSVLAGLSYDGEHYFRENPLASDGTHRRWEWHPCPSSATNVARLIAAVGGLFYSTGEDGLAVHLYGGATTTMNVGGKAVSLVETSAYPWDGDVSIALDPEAPAEFTLRLRIPAWAREATARVNGAGIDVAGNVLNGYLGIRRIWNPGDRVTLTLPMPVERLRAHPKVTADIGRIALKRGPLVYCFEQADNHAAPLERMRLPKGGALAPRRSGLFGGIATVTAEGVAAEADWKGALYRADAPEGKPAQWTAVPYYLWGNRDAGKMLVWIAEN